MKVALYFGSFNPVHIGHCIIAGYIADHTDADQVWFVVSPQNPLKPSAALLNEYHRLHLVKLAVENDPRLKVSDIEFSLPRPSYTIDTLTYLSEKYPQHEFAVVMGSDSFQNIGKWKNAAQLVANYDIYVYNRPGHSANNEIKTRITILDAPLLDISSTFIRETIRAKKSIRFLVPEEVREEIENNGYYK
jgi:nicotinate-nucleotide adenylyltransferase